MPSATISLPPYRGLLLALEGIDGSGTTTQAARLVQRLDASASGSQRPTAHLTCEPSRGPIGQLLRQVLANERQLGAKTTALLFAADRLDHLDVEVEGCLRRGQDVVSDRYVYSSLAYQSVQMPMAWVFQINAQAPSPDLAIYLRVSPEVAGRRRQQRGEPAQLFDHLALQQQIASCYDELLGSAPHGGTWRPGHDGHWRRDGLPRSHFGRTVDVAVIDGERSVEQVHEHLWSLVKALRQLKENETP